MRKIIFTLLICCILVPTAFAEVVVPKYVMIPTSSECDLYDYWYSTDYSVYCYGIDEYDGGLCEVQCYTEEPREVDLIYTISASDAPYDKMIDARFEYSENELKAITMDLRDSIKEIPVNWVCQHYHPSGALVYVEFRFEEQYKNEMVWFWVLYYLDGSYRLVLRDNKSQKNVEVRDLDLELQSIVDKYKSYLKYISTQSISIIHEGYMDLDNMQQWVNLY